MLDTTTLASDVAVDTVFSYDNEVTFLVSPENTTTAQAEAFLNEVIVLPVAVQCGGYRVTGTHYDTVTEYDGAGNRYVWLLVESDGDKYAVHPNAVIA